MAQIADDTLGEVCDVCGRGSAPVAPNDRLRAIDLLGKYGPGTRREIEAVLSEQGALEFAHDLAEAIKKHVVDDHALEEIYREFLAMVNAYF